MVSIRGHSLQRWLSRRNRARRYLLLGHTMGLTLADMGAIVYAYRRAQREVRVSLARRRRVQAATFNLNAFSSVQSLSMFRFLPADVGRLANLLHVDVVFGEPSYRVTPVECLCIVLRRLASPARWSDLEEIFGRSVPALCTIFYATVEVILSQWGALLSDWHGTFMRERAPLYASRIEQSGAFLDRCVGFIDGTALFIPRPGAGLQRACYSGHKRRHAIKFQSVLTPDGLIFHLYGPVEGRRHDMTLYHESGLDAILANELVIDGVQFHIYGDAAYFLRPWLQTAFQGILTAQEAAFNDSMKVPRTAVEWGFKDVKQTCTTLDYPRKLKIRESPVGQLYNVGVLFWNFRCCLYGGATSTFFTCPPPTLGEYLALAGVP